MQFTHFIGYFIAQLYSSLKHFLKYLNHVPDIVPCLQTGSNDFAIFQGFFSSVFEHEKHEKKIGGRSLR
jgi:hypothetical protein